MRLFWKLALAISFACAAEENARDVEKSLDAILKAIYHIEQTHIQPYVNRKNTSIDICMVSFNCGVGISAGPPNRHVP